MPPAAVMKENRIAEIQGLYGPVSVSEKLLQKIWLRGDYNGHDLKTLDGLPLKVKSPGIWNLLEGPDFKHAEIAVSGRRKCGDVEMHFYMKDWYYHHHDRNPDFNQVVLHVLLFEPAPGDKQAVTAKQEEPYTLVLLPYLRQDIEEYANEEALIALEKREQLDFLEPFLGKTREARRNELIQRARRRWRQKMDFAKKRIAKRGWKDACHESCLEVLGYSRNRTPMLNLASRFSLDGMVQARLTAEELFEMQKGRWKLAGLRPANHPLKRLAQYLALLEKIPDWPKRLGRFACSLERFIGGNVETGGFRHIARLKEVRQRIFKTIVGETVSGSRLDTLICDAFLPLLAADTNENYFPYWLHWYAGDMPDNLADFLKQTEITDGKAWPACNGFNQGGLQIFIEEGV